MKTLLARTGSYVHHLKSALLWNELSSSKAVTNGKEK
jgi:hypothetical protein